MERWKVIKGFEKYSVSDTGEVKSNKNDHIKANRIDRRGYNDISLYKNGQEHHKKVHRLVAEAFVDNPEGKDFVNHKDGNKLNNSKDNLEWVTHSENMKHAYATGLAKPHPTYGMLGKKNPNGGAKGKPIRCIENDTIYKSTAECARSMGLKDKAITETLKGRQKTHRGYHFEYSDK